MNKYFSLPLFKENLKRFWPLSAVGFAVYFMVGPFTLITMDYDSWYHYAVKWAIGYENIAYMFMHVVMGCLAAVVVFSYLHKTNSVAAVHAMPFSRKSLYITNYVSGLCLALIPLVLNTIVLFLVKRDYYTDSTVEYGTEVLSGQNNIFTAAAIMRFFGLGLVCIIFIYAIAVLAGMISGNTVIHVLTAPALNFVIPAFILSLMAYGELFLRGFNGSQPISEVAMRLSPILLMVSDGLFYGSETLFTAKWHVIYLLAAAAISVLGYFAYKKRKLERAGDSYVFDFVKYIIAFFFVYFGATLLGMIFQDEHMLIAMLIGGAVGFVIGWMIVNKSFRIFNMNALKAVGIYALVMLLIVAVFKFDLTGYNRRIPQASDVEEVTVYSNFDYYGGYTGFSFKDEANIEAVRQLHKGVVDKNYNPKDSDDYGGYSYVSISYLLKNGKELSRTYYDVPYTYWADSKDLKALYESAEFMKQYDGIDEIVPRTIEIANQWTDRSIIISDKKEMQELLTVLEKDMKNRSFEDNIYGKEPFINIWIEGSEKSEYGDYYDSVSYSVGQESEGVLNWLDEKGYLNEIMESLDNGFMVLTRTPETYYGFNLYEATEHGIIPESRNGLVTVTDNELLKDIVLNSSYGNQFNRRFEGRDGDIWAVYFYDNGLHHYYENRNVYVDAGKLPAELKAELKQYNVID